jgi:hypothetical protein
MVRGPPEERAMPAALGAAPAGPAGVTGVSADRLLSEERYLYVLIGETIGKLAHDPRKSVPRTKERTPAKRPR